MSRRLLLPAAALLALCLTAPALASPFPSEIPLPGGYRPEGITAGTGTTAYVGSLADGAIVSVNVRTGSVDPFAAGATGRVTAGLDYEDGAHRLWAAGGPTGEVRAYDTRTGEILETYSVTAGFLNDVVVTEDAVYVTDSLLPQLIVIPLPDDGSLPDPADAFALPLTGDLVYVDGFNANGIVASGGWLILVLAYVVRKLPFTVRSSSAILHQIDPSLEEASINLGVSPLATFVRLMIPLMLGGIVGGMVLTWVAVASELSATVVLYSSQWQTLTVVMFQALEGTGAGLAAATVSMLILFTVVPVAFVYRLLRRYEMSLL